MLFQILFRSLVFAFHDKRFPVPCLVCPPPTATFENSTLPVSVPSLAPLPNPVHDHELQDIASSSSVDQFQSQLQQQQPVSIRISHKRV